MKLEEAIKAGIKAGLSEETILRRLAEIGAETGDQSQVQAALGENLPKAQRFLEAA